MLLADDPTDKSLARLELVARTSSGFKLAEEDMRLRGTGELLGSRQHGLTDAAMDALLQPHLLDDVRQEAERLVQGDPSLNSQPALRAAVVRRLELTSIS